MRRWWAMPAVAALWVAIEVHPRLARLRLARPGQRRNRHGLPLRLAPFTGVYGLSFVFALMAAALALAILRRPRLRTAVAAPAACCCSLLPALPDAAARHATPPLLVQPNISEDRAVDRRVARPHASSNWHALAARRAGRAGTPPSLIVWPEVPAPFYYDDDPRFRDYIDNLARSRARLPCCSASWRTRRSGAPLNSAALISPERQRWSAATTR